jgi:molecular chaperone GrpE
MSDRPKNSPINIPINFVESTHSGDRAEEPYDDAIEIDGDALDFESADDEPTVEVKVADAQEADDVEETSSEEVIMDDERDTDTEDVIDADYPTTETHEIEQVREGTEATSNSFIADPEPTPTGRSELSVEAFTRLSQELRQKLELAERLGAEKNDLYDRLLRKQAEFENFRKRTEREMQEAYRRARADILLDILPALDNMERALKHADNADATVLHEGLALIYKQLSDALGKHGLEAIDSIGSPFDPELHEAVAAEQNDDVDDHTVLDELQRGYKLGDRLLRPARVKVSVQS